jgi:ribosomal protein S2
MSKQYIINHDAKTCGEFYCGYMWKRGLLSNYRSMLRSIKNVVRKNHYEKKNDFFFFFKT